MLDLELARLGRTFADDVDCIVRLDSLIAEASNVIFRRMLVRVNHQPVYFADCLIAEFRHTNAR
jgi:hypothetical protein